MKYDRNSRTLKISKLASKEFNGLPDNLEIEISYTGSSNANKAILLDNLIIPRIVQALNDEFSYSYVDQEGKALRTCSKCGNNFEGERGISLVLSIANKMCNAYTYLHKGMLIDTFDHAVAKGFHSETQCGECYESLVDYEVTNNRTSP